LPPKIVFIPKWLRANILETLPQTIRVNTQYLTIWDLVLTPIYLGILIFIAKRYRDRYYPVGNPLRKYYLPGLYVKLFGAIFIALIYQYYYGGGDTFRYFNGSRIINSSIDDSFALWLKLLLRMPPDSDPKLFSYTSQMEFYVDPASHTVTVISSLFGLFNFTTYLPIALLFAYFSYTGIWAMYRTFVKIYPSLVKPLAIAFLFIPSTFVWGSAIFKDTVCMFGLGWMTYCTFRLFINRDFSLKNIGLLVLSFYLIATIKLYILLAFLPALSLWLLMTYSHRIGSAGTRLVVNTFFVGLIAGGFFFFANRFSEELGKYSLEKVVQTAQVTKGYINYSTSDEGSAYDLGEYSPTFQGMLSKFPASIVVTLFRPFLWEAKKVIVVLSAIEAIIFLGLTLFVFFKNGVIEFFRRIFSDPNLTFLLIFSLIFAFAVGISSGNFGALSRYKIPCMPFYGAFLMILINYEKLKHTRQHP
jgi:hypothetical protein